MKEIEAIDTLRNAVLDTAGKTDMEKHFIEKIGVISNTPADELASTVLHQAVIFGLKVVAALIIYFLGGYLIKLVKKMLARSFARRKTDQAVVSFTTSLVSFVLWVILAIIVIGTLGIETTSFAALLTAGGMAIGMALSGAVQNFAGGIMILIFKPFGVGDFISAQGFSGTVTSVNITSTKIITVDNREVVLPNGALSSGTIDNYSKKPLRRVDFAVSVEYGSDAEQVKQALLEIASADPRILTVSAGAPADPFAAIKELGSSSVNFTFRVWCKASDYWGVYFDTNEKIYSQLPQKGINFPFPQMTVHMKN